MRTWDMWKVIMLLRLHHLRKNTQIEQLKELEKYENAVLNYQLGKVSVENQIYIFFWSPGHKQPFFKRAVLTRFRKTLEKY